VDRNDVKQDCLTIIVAVWNGIKWEDMGGLRIMGIYDELLSKIKSSALTSSLPKFIENLTRKFDVRGIHDTKIIDICKQENEAEILRTFREETIILVLMLREYIDKKKEAFVKKQAEKQKQEEGDKDE